MRSVRSVPFSVSRVALSLALAAGVAFVANNVDAQSRGGKPVAAYPGAKPSSGWHGGQGGHGNWRGGGNWHGGHGSWHGGHGRHWRGGHHGHGRHHHWALGLGVGIGLAYPWWGWGYAYPPSYVVYERVYDAPVGIVVDRDAPPPTPAYRWYCPSPPGYHPDVRECSTGWLKVLPQDGGPPPSTPPRSSAPADDEPAARIAPGTVGHVSSPMRIAAPRMTPPAQLAGGYASPGTLAQNVTPVQ